MADILDPFAYIAPVSHDGVFFYDDHSGLFVKVDGRRYPRADPERLYGLLTWVDKGPVLTKKGVPRKRQPPPHQDESSAYYTAQLMHLDLKPMKSKAAAKKALLAIFGDSHDVKVPERLQTLEEELRNLWDTENEKARICHEQELEAKEKKEQERLAERLRVHEAILADVDEEDIASQAAPAGKRKANSKGGGMKKKAKASGSDQKLATSDVGGKYAIIAPYLAEQWPDFASGDLELSLSPSPETDRHVWGKFNFGIFTGVIRGGAPPKSVGGTIAFEWRGREEGEGQMEYGSDHKGILTFLGDGKLRGTMEGNYTFTFTGVQKPRNNVVWAKHVKKWKGEWRRINDRSYRAAEVSRWGKWHEDEDYEEEPAGSDTTDAKDASSDNDETTYDCAF